LRVAALPAVGGRVCHVCVCLLCPELLQVREASKNPLLFGLRKSPLALELTASPTKVQLLHAIVSMSAYRLRFFDLVDFHFSALADFHFSVFSGTPLALSLFHFVTSSSLCHFVTLSLLLRPFTFRVAQLLSSSSTGSEVVSSDRCRSLYPGVRQASSRQIDKPRGNRQKNAVSSSDRLTTYQYRTQ
jgi:hypothetical protein